MSESIYNYLNMITKDNSFVNLDVLGEIGKCLLFCKSIDFNVLAFADVRLDFTSMDLKEWLHDFMVGMGSFNINLYVIINLKPLDSFLLHEHPYMLTNTLNLLFEEFYYSVKLQI